MIRKSFLLIVLAPLSITCFLWGAWVSGTLIMILCWASMSSKVARRQFFVLILICGVSIPIALNQTSSKMDILGKTIRTEGPEALSTPDRLSIYLGNIYMGIAGFLMLAPEVALETLFLMYPHQDNSSYEINYGFAMGSSLIREHVEQYAKDVVETGSHRLKRIPLRWDIKQPYSLAKDYRVALAVAGGGLTGTAEKVEEGYALNMTVTINVAYSNNYTLPIINTKWVRFYIDEAIFGALQDVGWFHTYVLRYRWQETAAAENMKT